MNIKAELSKRELGWFNVARRMAEAAEEFGSARVAAVLVHKNTLIACGTNGNKKSPKALIHTLNKEKIYPHAEVGVLYRAAKLLDLSDFRRSVLYVVRVNKAGELALACPCSDCQCALGAFGVRKVIYSSTEVYGFTEDYRTGKHQIIKVESRS